MGCVTVRNWPGRRILAFGIAAATAIVFGVAASVSGGAATKAAWSGPGSAAPSADVAWALAVQPDGKIVVAGDTIPGGGLAAARYTTTGHLDRSFGAGGKVVLTGLGRARAVAVQADGKIVVADDDASYDSFVLVRFTRTGQLDPSFGRGGRAVDPLAGDCGGYAHALALQADGKIVVAGECSSDAGGFEIARFTSGGQPDQSFGTAGHVVIDFGGSGSPTALAVASQADGGIVAAGPTDDFSKDSDVAIARLTPDGRLDPRFGNGGKVLRDFGPNDGALGIGLQADGKIVIGGRPSLTRYDSDGTLDASFGQGGALTSGVVVNGGLALQRDGMVVVAGYREDHLALARYTPAGRLDPAFGVGGTISIAITDNGKDWANAVALQPDGKILAAATSELSNDFADFALARVDQAGHVDPSFGGGGKVVTNFAFVVSSLSAARTKAGVVVRWRTGCEANTAGFSVYRVDRGRRIRLSPKLILPMRGNHANTYSFLDRNAPASAHIYWLQELKRYPYSEPRWRPWYGPTVVGS